MERGVSTVRKKLLAYHKNLKRVDGRMELVKPVLTLAL
jgi:hypothetical protein